MTPLSVHTDTHVHRFSVLWKAVIVSLLFLGLYIDIFYYRNNSRSILDIIQEMPGSSLDARATVIKLLYRNCRSLDDLHTFCTYKAQPIREKYAAGDSEFEGI